MKLKSLLFAFLLPIVAAAQTYDFSTPDVPPGVSIQLGGYSTGWWDSELGAQGWWDLGSGGTLTESSPIPYGARYVKLRVTYWYDGGIFQTPTLRTTGTVTPTWQIVDEVPYAWGKWVTVEATVSIARGGVQFVSLQVAAPTNGALVDDIGIIWP